MRTTRLNGTCYYHRFDPATHRCTGCGRWQAGYAPKKVTKNPKAECQVCERQQCVDSRGVMVHHGYTRPGDGWIHGDCFGVGHKPYTATSALILWHDAVADLIGRTEDRLDNLPLAETLVYEYTEYLGNGVKRPATLLLKKGDRADYTPHRSHPSFEDHQAFLIKIVSRELEQQRAELHRVAARIVRAVETK